MQAIEIYYKKIDKMLAERENSPKQKGNGLLSPSMRQTVKEVSSDDRQLRIIADIVDGIRAARKEMKNGK